MFNLKVISSSVRVGRKGIAIARWISEVATMNGNFRVDLLDLGEMKLPMMDEPHHPRERKYVHEHTRTWSELIDQADAFVFVTAEYDHNYPAPLRNALEYLLHEWAYKPAGIVSYGGVSGGTRASNSLKSDLTSLKVVPLFEQVNLPFFTQFINADGKFGPNEITIKAADAMLKELVRWSYGMKLIKENKFAG